VKAFPCGLSNLAGQSPRCTGRAALKRLPPFLSRLLRVDRNTPTHGFVAGLTVAIQVLPQGVAFATIAGMPPEYGLYAGVVPSIITALFGSS